MTEPTWRALRRLGVLSFVERLAARHPELRAIVHFEDVVTMAHREGIAVRVVPLPPAQRARLVRVGQHVFIRINRQLSAKERAIEGLHELAHFWRDDPGVPAYYSDELTGGESCRFADLVAWYCTSPARGYLRPHDPPGADPAEDALDAALRRSNRTPLRRLRG